MSSPVAWSVVARNLPEHAGNAIHTDAGARAAGFPGALVAGVTTYAYLVHPLVAAWGLDWVHHGGGEVRFRSPVFADETITCITRTEGEVTIVDAVTPDHERTPRATFRAVRDTGPPPPLRSGEALPTRRVTLEGPFGADYARRAGDDLELFEQEAIVHPAVWPAIANRVMAEELVRGAWIHTRSVIRHHALARAGTTVDVHAVVIDRFERGGRRAVVDVVIELSGTPIATLEHEAIVELR